MSDILCIYYSRTGNTKKAMEEIAAALDAETLELTDGVANQCQDLSRRIIYEKVRFPEELKGDVLEMVRLTQEQLEHFSQRFAQPETFQPGEVEDALRFSFYSM